MHYYSIVVISPGIMSILQPVKAVLDKGTNVVSCWTANINGLVKALKDAGCTVTAVHQLDEEAGQDNLVLKSPEQLDSGLN